MSATRLLVLGVVRIHQRAHGYLVTSELQSWYAQEWANVKTGSIYHALRQLTKEGLLQSTEIAEWPGRTDYEITEYGDAEFFALLRDALRGAEHRADMVGAGLALMNALPRAEVLDLLTERLAALKAKYTAIVEETAGRAEPGHIGELFALWAQSASSAESFTRGLIERLRGGAYVMAGE